MLEFAEFIGFMRAEGFIPISDSDSIATGCSPKTLNRTSGSIQCSSFSGTETACWKTCSFHIFWWTSCHETCDLSFWQIRKALHRPGMCTHTHPFCQPNLSSSGPCTLSECRSLSTPKVRAVRDTSAVVAADSFATWETSSCSFHFVGCCYAPWIFCLNFHGPALSSWRLPTFWSYYNLNYITWLFGFAWTCQSLNFRSRGCALLSGWVSCSHPLGPAPALSLLGPAHSLFVHQARHWSPLGWPSGF